MTLTLDPGCPPMCSSRWPSRAEWWRYFGRIVVAGAPIAFVVGALAGIFLTGPAPALPARAPATAADTPSLETAPPATRTAVRPTLAVPEVRTLRKATPVAASSPPGRAPAAPTTSSTARAYWANCTQAREAGVVDIPAGSPEYRTALDRDGDGFGCDSSGEAPREPVELDEPKGSKGDPKPVESGDGPPAPQEPDEWSPEPAGPEVDGGEVPGPAR